MLEKGEAVTYGIQSAWPTSRGNETDVAVKVGLDFVATQNVGGRKIVMVGMIRTQKHILPEHNSKLPARVL